jgi:hypothetical protein
VSDAEALADMKAEALNPGGIDVSQARQQAQRLRNLQASGYPMTAAQLDVLAACERRVRFAETFSTPKEMPR